MSASNAGGTSAFSAAFSFTTIVALPGAPTLAAPPDSAINLPVTTTVSWNVTMGATVYHLQVSTSSSFLGNVVDDTTITATSKSIGPLNLATTYCWRVRAKNAAGFDAFSAPRSFKTIRTTWVEQLEGAIPTECALTQNYPNPFNPSTTICYQLSRAAHVTLKVYSTLGTEVATLVSESQNAGFYQVRWNAKAQSGVYFYCLQAGSYVQTRKLILLK